MGDRYRGAAHHLNYPLPPPPPRAAYDSYWPSSHAPVQQASSYYPPPPPSYGSYPPQPPLPSGPPPSSYPPVFQFGQQQDGHRPRESDFHFQSRDSLPSYPQHDAARYNDYRDRNDHRARYEGRDDRRDYDRRDNDRRGRPFVKRSRLATDRPLLQDRRDDSPVQFEGMQDSGDNPKFRNLDNMSDSQSEIMEESESENGKEAESVQQIVPKWSNPETYTSMPPSDTTRKRKNVVKLIRKARIDATKAEEEHLKQLAKNDDFISFGFEDDNSTAPADAPTGPRADRVVGNGHIDSVAVSAREDEIDITEEVVFPPVSNSIASRLTAHKRKRSIDDVGSNGGSQASPKRAKKTGAPPSGKVLNEWLAKHSSEATPWAGQHQWTENDGFRLHKEICDFYEFVRPHKFEETMRMDLLTRIRKVVKRKHPDCEVHAFGSFAAGLYLPDADIDCVVISHNFATTGVSLMQSKNMLWKLSEFFVENKLAEPRSVEVIIGAKVPLIKFRDVKTGIRVDVSFENLTGPRAVATFRNWKAKYPAMPLIVTLLKQFLMMRGLNEVVNGGLGGFSVTCLVVALLQNMPRVQTGQIVPENNLGEILLEFLDLYGNQFDLYGTAIQLDPPGFVHKSSVSKKKLDGRQYRLHIVDPNDRENDISGGSSNITNIFGLFSQARTQILSAMSSKNPTSLLGWMLGGNYGVYTAQRAILDRLYRGGKWSDIDIANEDTLLSDLKWQTRDFSGPVNAGSILTHQNTRSSKAKAEKATSSETTAKKATDQITADETHGKTLTISDDKNLALILQSLSRSEQSTQVSTLRQARNTSGETPAVESSTVVTRPPQASVTPVVSTNQDVNQSAQAARPADTEADSQYFNKICVGRFDTIEKSRSLFNAEEQIYIKSVERCSATSIHRVTFTGIHTASKAHHRLETMLKQGQSAEHPSFNHLAKLDLEGHVISPWSAIIPESKEVSSDPAQVARVVLQVLPTPKDTNMGNPKKRNAESITDGVLLAEGFASEEAVRHAFPNEHHDNIVSIVEHHESNDGKEGVFAVVFATPDAAKSALASLFLGPGIYSGFDTLMDAQAKLLCKGIAEPVTAISEDIQSAKKRLKRDEEKPLEPKVDNHPGPKEAFAQLASEHEAGGRTKILRLKRARAAIGVPLPQGKPVPIPKNIRNRNRADKVRSDFPNYAARIPPGLKKKRAQCIRHILVNMANSLLSSPKALNETALQTIHANLEKAGQSCFWPQCTYFKNRPKPLPQVTSADTTSQGSVLTDPQKDSVSSRRQKSLDIAAKLRKEYPRFASSLPDSVETEHKTLWCHVLAIQNQNNSGLLPNALEKGIIKKLHKPLIEAKKQCPYPSCDLGKSVDNRKAQSNVPANLPSKSSQIKIQGFADGDENGTANDRIPEISSGEESSDDENEEDSDSDDEKPVSLTRHKSVGLPWLGAVLQNSAGFSGQAKHAQQLQTATNIVSPFFNSPVGVTGQLKMKAPSFGMAWNSGGLSTSNSQPKNDENARSDSTKMVFQTDLMDLT